MSISFSQVRDAPLLHPISEHPSKEQRPHTRGSCLILCREGSAARGFNETFEAQIGPDLLEVCHSLIVNTWKISG